MAYVFFNPNPYGHRVGDCAIRAVCKALGKDWDDAYIALCAEGLAYKDLPSSNYVWGMYLRRYGFVQRMIPSICPKCTTVESFAKNHPHGRYVLGCQSHTVCIVDGDFFDTWDSGGETVLFYFAKET